MTHLFPKIIIVLSYSAALVYASRGMVWPATYWGCAGTLNMSVLFMSGG